MESRITIEAIRLSEHNKIDFWSNFPYNSLGKYQIQSRQKEQFYTKDKTALNVILSNCTNSRTVSRETYGDCIFPESRESSYFL